MKKIGQLCSTPEATATSEAVHLGVKNKELTNLEQMKAVASLIGRVKNGVLSHGLISIVTRKFSMGHVAMSHLWGHTCSASLDGLIISPEINSQKNETGRNPKYFMKDVNTAVKLIPLKEQTTPQNFTKYPKPMCTDGYTWKEGYRLTTLLLTFPNRAEQVLMFVICFGDD